MYINLGRLGSSFMTVGTVGFIWSLSGTLDLHWATSVAVFVLGVALTFLYDRLKKSPSTPEKIEAHLSALEALQRRQSQQAAGARKSARGR